MTSIVALAAAPVRQRSLVSGVHVQLGMLTVSCDVVSQTVPNLKKETGSRLVCPTCVATATVTPVSQRYICPLDHEHGPFEQTELARAREIDEDGTLAQVTDQELAAVRSSGEVEVKTLTLQVFPADEFEATTRPGESGYRLRPGTKAPAVLLRMYGLLVEIASRTDVALVGEFRYRDDSQDKLYRLNVWADAQGQRQLCITEMVRPSDLMPLDQIEAPAPSDKERAQAELLLDALLEDYDPDDFRNTARERAAALDEAKAADPDVVVVNVPATPKEAKTGGDDLEAMLAMAVAGTSKLTTMRKARPAEPRIRTPKGQVHEAEPVTV